jgi:hypothetical protein
MMGAGCCHSASSFSPWSSSRSACSRLDCGAGAAARAGRAVGGARGGAPRRAGRAPPRRARGGARPCGPRRTARPPRPAPHQAAVGLELRADGAPAGVPLSAIARPVEARLQRVPVEVHHPLPVRHRGSRLRDDRARVLLAGRGARPWGAQISPGQARGWRLPFVWGASGWVRGHKSIRESAQLPLPRRPQAPPRVRATAPAGATPEPLHARTRKAAAGATGAPSPEARPGSPCASRRGRRQYSGAAAAAQAAGGGRGAKHDNARARPAARLAAVTAARARQLRRLRPRPAR